MYRHPSRDFYVRSLAKQGRRGRSKSSQRQYAQQGPSKRARTRGRRGNLRAEMPAMCAEMPAMFVDAQNQMWVAQTPALEGNARRRRGKPQQQQQPNPAPPPRQQQQNGKPKQQQQNGKPKQQNGKPKQQQQNGKPKQQQQNGKPKQQQPRQQQPKSKKPGIAKNPYKVYGLISSDMPTIAKLSKNASAAYEDVFGSPLSVRQILKESKEFAEDLMHSENFFEGRREAYIPPYVLQYVYHDNDTSQISLGEREVPKYIADFDDLLNGRHTGTGQEKYQAVLAFLAALKKAIRTAVNRHATYVRDQRQREQLAKAMADKAHVPESTDLRAVEDAIVEKILKSSEEELKAMKFTPAMSRVIPKSMLLHYAEHEFDGRVPSLRELLKMLAKDSEALYDFVFARRDAFEEGVKAARSVVRHRKLAAKRAERRAGEGEQAPHSEAAAPRSEAKAASVASERPSGLASMLVSMRYD